MQSKNIYFINANQDLTTQISSTLRNSGINIHIKNVSSASSLKQELDGALPLFLLFRTTKEQQLDFPPVVELAAQYDVPLIVQLTPEDNAFIPRALAFSPLHLLNAESDAQLIELVRHYMDSASEEVESGKLKNRISELELQTHQLLEESEEAIAYQLEGLHIYANRAYLRMMDVSDATDLQTLSLLELAQGTETDIKSILREISGGKLPEDPVSTTIRTAKGAEFNASLMFSPAQMNGEECIQVRVRQQNTEVNPRHEAEHSKEPGPVGGLSNRPAFIHELQAFVTQCQQEDRKGSLLFIEPENASLLSRSMGFCAFNQVSTDLAAVISQHLSKHDLAAPIGECAFAVLFKEDKGQRAASTFDEVVRSLGESGLDDVKIRAGMTTIATQTLSADEVMDQARLAFADALAGGRSLERFKPSPPLSGDQHDDQHWRDRIRYALNSESFYSVQMAIVNLEGESEGLFENHVFLRDEQDDIPAADFLPHSERHELGSHIDRLVIPGLLKSIAGTGDRHIITLSANSLLDFSFPSWFQHQTKELGAQGSQLIIQIPADLAVSNPRQCQRLINELKSGGVGFSLDGFDASNRHLELFNMLDIELVRLNSSLSESLKSNTENQDMIKNIAHAAGKAGAMVVAGNVQDTADMATLWQCGVKLVCGDFLSEPLQING